MNQILKVLIGSRAHGTHNDNSDYDYRGVFVTPTKEILSLTGSKDQTSWLEGKTDDVSYEIQKFLIMSSKCNPNVLEMYGAPVIESTELGEELRALFPHVWNSKDTFNAFRGYGANQRKKFFDNKDQRSHKYLGAWMRTLWQAIHLFQTGEITCDFIGTTIFDDLMGIRSGNYDQSDKLAVIFSLERKLEKIYEDFPEKHTDMDRLNEFLLKVRNLN